MNRFVSILARLKRLGLIGLLGSVTGNAYLKLFWLFFLLGFIEIFGNLSVFCQSIQQLLSFPLILFRHRFRLPSKENYAGTTDCALPFAGQRYVANGGMDKKASRSCTFARSTGLVKIVLNRRFIHTGLSGTNI